MGVAPPRLVISGGQSGGDLGGNEGARVAGVATCVRTFRGFQPLGGRRLEQLGYPVYWLDLQGSYAAKLHQRTEHNVLAGDATVIFVHRPVGETRGSLLTFDLCARHQRPVCVLTLGHRDTTKRLVAFLRRQVLAAPAPLVLNVAGQRTCNEAHVALLLSAALRLLTQEVHPEVA